MGEGNGSDRSYLACAVTSQPELIQGGLPVFVVQNEKQRIAVAELLGRLLKGVPHELPEGLETYVIVQHG